MIHLKATGCAGALRRSLHDSIWALLQAPGDSDDEDTGRRAKRLKKPTPEDDAAAAAADAAVAACAPASTAFVVDARLLYAVDRAPSSATAVAAASSAGECEENSTHLYEVTPVVHGGGDDGPASALALALRACWNCGETDHPVRDCPQPFDPKRVAEGRRRFQDAAAATSGGGRGGGGADASADPDAAAAELARAFPHVAPGRVSARLRAALGIAAGEPPPWLRRMRRHGYPPALLQPAPEPDADRHWGYGGNGPLSALLAGCDPSYEGVFPHCAAGADRAAAALVSRAARERVDMVTGAHHDDHDDYAAAAPSPVAAQAATSAAGADAPPPPPLGLFDAPPMAGVRLTPFFPVCTCGRVPTAALPGLSVAWDPATMMPQAAEAAEGSSAEDGEEGPATAAAAPLPPFKWPRPVVEAGYCLVHRSRVVRGGSGTAPAPVPQEAASSAPAPLANPEGSVDMATSEGGDGAGDGGAPVGAPPAAESPSDDSGDGDDDGGATHTQRNRRLSRFLTARDPAALAAAVNSVAGSWYAHIGGSASSSLVYSDAVRDAHVAAAYQRGRSASEAASDGEGDAEDATAAAAAATS